MRMETKNYLQVYLEECKYKMKKTKMKTFIEAELESDSESGSESESKSDTGLMAKLNLVLILDNSFVISIIFTHVLTIHF